MRRALFISIALLVAPSSARAWYDHTVLMNHVQVRLEREFPLVGDGLAWSTLLPPERAVSATRYEDVAALLLLQSGAASTLRSRDARTLHDLLRFGAEDPDQGLDRDLPDSADPSDDRRYMGGTRGPGSQGFRHMFWTGWNWRRPIATFQIPARTLGQAPDRIELLANEARERVRRGEIAWGARILAWAIHYLQDLAQPFHAVALPTFGMIPPSAARALIAWPPGPAFAAFQDEITRSVTNYHWAYEGYVREKLLDGANSTYRECFDRSGGTLLVASPRELALEVAKRSLGRAHETGAALLALTGASLRDTGVNIPSDPSRLNLTDLLRLPELAPARARLDATTCESLRLATDATVWITRWVFGR